MFLNGKQRREDKTSLFFKLKENIKKNKEKELYGRTKKVIRVIK